MSYGKPLKKGFGTEKKMKRQVLLFATLLVFWSAVGNGETAIKTTIKNQRFVPDEFHLKGEASVIFQISNEDNIPVEFESTDLNKEKIVLPGKTLELTLKGLKPGIYEFFSDFGPKELRGRIIVE